MTDYKKLYEEALERARDLHDNHTYGEPQNWWTCEQIFPELKESDDEKIRKDIIAFLQSKNGYMTPDEDYEFHSKWIKWLEKQKDRYIVGFDIGHPNGDKECRFDYSNANIHQKDFAPKFEPKFKVGDWVVHDMSDGRKVLRQIVNKTNKSYVLDSDGFNTFYFSDLEKDYHLWTIQDAKDGDVLYSHNKNLLWIYKDETTYHTCVILDYVQYGGIAIKCDIVIPLDTCPATKSQRDTLFAKMKEAGYGWDAENKELKITDWSKYIKYNPNSPSAEQKPTDLSKGEDYDIDRLYVAIDILQKTLGKVEGYQSDDGILEHKAAITAIQKVKEQKSIEWSEEDETVLSNLIYALANDIIGNGRDEYVEWLKSLEERIKK